MGRGRHVVAISAVVIYIGVAQIVVVKVTSGTSQCSEERMTLRPLIPCHRHDHPFAARLVIDDPATLCAIAGVVRDILPGEPGYIALFIITVGCRSCPRLSAVNRLPAGQLAINLHSGEHFEMGGTSTSRIRISIATRDFAAFQRTPTRQQMTFANILQSHALL